MIEASGCNATREFCDNAMHWLAREYWARLGAGGCEVGVVRGLECSTFLNNSEKMVSYLSS